MSENILIALIGVSGAIIGSLATMASQWLRDWLERRAAARRDTPRKQLLKAMLDHPQYAWRELSTLQHVIGADTATTQRLLLELGARASEDGRPLWGLISRNPLPTQRA